jgi:hypothetical protein
MLLWTSPIPVNGVVAGQFLQRLRRTLESFHPGEGIWVDSLLIPV